MEWVRGDTVGHGSFGTVNLAIPRSQSSQIPPLMAVKSCGVSQSASLMNEKLILDDLDDCPQIIRCFGDDFSFENGEKLYNLLLEYASGGSLADKLRNSGYFRLPESDVRQYTKSILKGLRYIHQNGYVHCDIKLQNMLLFSSRHGGDAVKIADFGLAKKAAVKREKLGFELRGTPLYMSPEVVATGEQESPADIWALGCVVAEMATGAPAWRCSPESGVGALFLRIGVGEEVPEIPGKLSEEGKDFLGKCFLKDPRKRWTAEMLLNHPFVADHDEDHDDHDTVPLKDIEASSTSPRSAFDFPDWESEQSSVTSSITSFQPSHSKSPAERLRQVATDRRPDCTTTESRKWILIKHIQHLND
ncbi:hypothetical protein F0562_006594 [Nyssa sinensis]|uniref:Protein kinase domain-containing protein n=1 Tax=Nyssa sinensis TaxID=561372 RepID=A0A5J5AN79_9ASTE|nr:hypothetical protein F0562_006594 [Nyssa sinensis]